MYTCERCLKEFKQKSHYNTHLKRKTPCQNNQQIIKNEVNQKIKELIPVHENMKFIDLCCGIGGFHQAMKNMGFSCVMASDIDKDCRENYKLNYGIEPRGDLTNIHIEDIPAFDILCAGFPCQPFSKAGEQRGFEDSRGNIFFDICKIVKHHNPKYILLENVRNLATHDDGNTWNVIKNTIQHLNYYTYDKPMILNTLYFGVPQSRERVVILCKRKDLGELPEISRGNIQNTTLETIIEVGGIESKYNISGKLKATEIIWDEFLDICNKNQINIPKFPIWTDWWDGNGVIKPKKGVSIEETNRENEEFYEKYRNWIDKNREFYREYQSLLQDWLVRSRENKLWTGAVRKMEWQTGKMNLTMKDVLWSPRGSGVRIKNIDYSPTLVAMASMIPVYGPQSRMLTPRECARLQSFPEDYIIHQNDKIAYKQFGNAVNVTMIEKSARFLIFGEPLFG